MVDRQCGKSVEQNWTVSCLGTLASPLSSSFNNCPGFVCDRLEIDSKVSNFVRFVHQYLFVLDSMWKIDRILNENCITWGTRKKRTIFCHFLSAAEIIWNSTNFTLLQVSNFQPSNHFMEYDTCRVYSYCSHFLQTHSIHSSYGVFL